ncbi:MAG: formate dehydrogenase accessory sulfurtransferase FdhD [Qingshengfaniella sp.]
MTKAPSASVDVPSLSAHAGGLRTVTRTLPTETPVAIVYNGSTQAVMMATPADLEDFAIGFGLSEGIIRTPAEIEDLRILFHDRGAEAQMWLAKDRAEALTRRRRAMAGPVGCGLCGIDSLEEAIRPARQVMDGIALDPAHISGAVDAMSRRQTLQHRTHATHAAGFFTPATGLVTLREDVGRHNALDKLIGALARDGIDGATGAVVITSRVSVEMVQKCAVSGAAILIAVSAPTSLALATAEAAGITLVALVRGETFEIFTHPNRIIGGAHAHVA